MKKILLFICTLILLPTIVFAIEPAETEVKVYDRNEYDNLGVNKKWKINSSNQNNVMNTPMVDANEYIYDFSGILDENLESELKEKIEGFRKEFKMELIILTYDKYFTDSGHETFATDFYDYNDFGLNLKGYSGILLYRNSYEADKFYDMYTFGDAQLYFDQTRYDNVLDSVYYSLSTGDYESGMNSFVDLTISKVRSGYAPTYRNAYVDDMGYIQYKFTPPIMFMVIGGAVAALIYYGVGKTKHRMVSKATKANDYLNTNSINYTKQLDEFVNSRTHSYTTSSSSGGGGGGGGGSHSGSSGGGHSSGGGRHG